VTAVTKLATGWWAARRLGVHTRGRWRAGAILISRGEFSIVIASLGADLNPGLGPLAAAYVLFMAVLGPLAARITDPLVTKFQAAENSVESATPLIGIEERPHAPTPGNVQQRR
jgi:CPA2 family monovalent cation:H+ antiporter-2